MGGVEVEVEVQRSRRTEHPVYLRQALAEEAEVFLETHVVVVAVVRDDLEGVAPAGETHPFPHAHAGPDGLQPADLPSAERGVDVYQVDAAVRQIR